MPARLAGQKYHASDANTYGCRYENSSSTTTWAVGTDHQLAFPVAIKSTALVAASGTNNNVFQLLADGWWDLATGLAWGNQNSQAYLYLAVGTATPGSQQTGVNPQVQTFGVWEISTPYFAAYGDSIVAGLSVATNALTTVADHRTFFAATYLGPSL